MRSGIRLAPYYVAVVIGYLVATVGLFVLGYQVMQWLRHGTWEPISVVTVLAWCGSDWARFPTEWIGIHKMLAALPLSLFFFVTGLIVYGIGLTTVENTADKNEHRSA